MKKYFSLFLLALFFPLAAFAEDTSSQPMPYIFNISYEDAQDAIGKALTEKFAAETKTGQTVAAIISAKKMTSLYSSNKPFEVEIRGLRTEPSTRRWSANVVIASEEKVLSAMPLGGRYVIMSEVPVLKHQVRYGDIINESDIEMKTFPQDNTRSDTVSDISDLIGRTPVRVVSPNRPVRSSEISPPALVKKNALVQMRYKTDSMEITTAGQALSDGAKGDVIEIRNTASKKITRAVVADSTTVDVIAAGVQTSQVAVPSAPINY